MEMARNMLKNPTTQIWFMLHELCGMPAINDAD